MTVRELLSQTLCVVLFVLAIAEDNVMLAIVACTVASWLVLWKLSGDEGNKE